jgi:hypothetical protein
MTAEGILKTKVSRFLLFKNHHLDAFIWCVENRHRFIKDATIYFQEDA